MTLHADETVINLGRSGIGLKGSLVLMREIIFDVPKLVCKCDPGGITRHVQLDVDRGMPFAKVYALHNLQRECNIVQFVVLKLICRFSSCCIAVVRRVMKAYTTFSLLIFAAICFACMNAVN